MMRMKRWLQVPTWFDEGVAMQVDYRPRYVQAHPDTLNTDAVRKLTSFSAFFSGR